MYKLATLHHTVSGEHSIIFSVPEIATEERGRSTIVRRLKGAVIRYIGYVYICTPIYKYCVKYHALLPLNGLKHRTFKIKGCSISKCSLVADKRLRSGLKAQQAHSPGQPSEEEEDEVIALGWSTAAKCALQEQKHGHKGQNVPTRKTFQCRAVSLCFWHEIMPFSAVILSISR